MTLVSFDILRQKFLSTYLYVPPLSLLVAYFRSISSYRGRWFDANIRFHFNKAGQAAQRVRRHRVKCHTRQMMRLMLIIFWYRAFYGMMTRYIVERYEHKIHKQYRRHFSSYRILRRYAEHNIYLAGRCRDAHAQGKWCLSNIYITVSMPLLLIYDSFRRPILITIMLLLTGQIIYIPHRADISRVTSVKRKMPPLHQCAPLLPDKYWSPFAV